MIGRILLRCLMLLLAALLVTGCGGDAESPQGEEPDLGARSAERDPGRTQPETGRTPKRQTQPDGGDGVRLLDEGDAESFSALARRLGGQVGITVGAPGDPGSEQLGPLRSGDAWSTIKVPIAAKVLETAGGPGALSADQKGLISRALTASDNAAADKLFASLGDHDAQAAAATGEVLREAGDTTTRVSAVGRDGFSPYGQTDWSDTQQHRFMALLAGDCVAGPASSRYLLSLMARVVADQAWGLGSAGAGAARFKGGWGPGIDGRYLVRQMGVIEINGKEVVVTLAAIAPDGRFASGKAAATALARWIVENVNAGSAEPVDC